MSSDQQALDVGGQFHHAEQDGCTCPIHRNRDRDPFTAPLGLSFADRVSVEPIPRHQAKAVYEAHHGYMASVPSVNLVHHGLHYRDELMGAITYRYPLLSRKKLYLDDGGSPVPEPLTADQVRRALPESLHYVALDVLELDRIGEVDISDTQILDGDSFVEAARVCLGVRMANLASASLARSQERFVDGPNCESNVDYLLTFVRSDYDASMVRALRDKGWTCVGWTEPKKPGNRKQRAIHERYKWVFLCPFDQVREQTDLDRWSA